MHATEWRRAVYASPLSSGAKLTVVALGDYMDWRSGAGVHGRPRTSTLSKDLGCHADPETLGKHLSAAVRLGLLVVTSDPSPGRACVYRAAVPTGEPAATAGAVLFDVLDDPLGGPHPHEDAGVPFEHPHQDAVEHPHQDATYQEHPDQEDQPHPPSPPGRPLLALVNTGGITEAARSGPAARPAEVVPRHVELVAAGLVAALPDDLPSRVVRRWERHVTLEVGRLLAAGWSTDQLVERTVRPSWRGVVNPGAVLVQRLRDIANDPPREVVEQPRCGRCDVNRQVERADGRMARCPDCHPLRVAEAPF